MLGSNETSITEDGGTLEDVTQLAYVAGPVIVDQLLTRLARDAARRPAKAAPDLVEKCLTQWKDVVAPAPQCRQSNRENVKPVIEILPKLPGRDGLLQVAIG